jgi:chromosome segregation protein
MEESGVTKLISVKLKNDEVEIIPAPLTDAPLFEDEEVELEEGRELPAGVNDPALVSEAELRPIRSAGAPADGPGRS